MTVTITKTYASEEALKSAEPEVLEILGRHDPID